jgi:hypothetical protein
MKSNMKKGVKITTKDNIVFDAENTLQDVFGINDFTPVKLDVNYDAYNKTVKDGEDFLKNFNAALSWVYSNHVDADTLSVREFSLDMMLEFERVFMLQNSKLIKLDVSFEKLLNLLDVDISMLKEFQYKHSENIGIQAFFTNRDGETDDTLNVRIDIEDFTTYTKNQTENDMLEAADNLMVALKEVERFAKVYPLTITQGISSFLLFDMRENKYRVNTTFMT